MAEIGRRLTYTGLSGDAGRDDNNVRAGQCLLQAIIRREVALDFSRGGDVGEIGGNARGVDDIEEAQLCETLSLMSIEET